MVEASHARDQILYLLKTEGPQTASQLAQRLEMTPMGARQHLAILAEQALVTHEDVRGSVGRPARYFRLAPAATARFPDRHADLVTSLIATTRKVFGQDGLDRLIAARARAQRVSYDKQMPARASLARRVAALAQLRCDEGYMAEVMKQRDGSFLLVENHCPICAAATQCQGFCRSELELFQTVLGADVTVERTEHLLSGARRCAYGIRRRR